MKQANPSTSMVVRIDNSQAANHQIIKKKRNQPLPSSVHGKNDEICDGKN